jgi:hypothetical protein
VVKLAVATAQHSASPVFDSRTMQFFLFAFFG